MFSLLLLFKTFQHLISILNLKTAVLVRLHLADKLQECLTLIGFVIIADQPIMCTGGIAMLVKMI